MTEQFILEGVAPQDPRYSLMNHNGINEGEGGLWVRCCDGNYLHAGDVLLIGSEIVLVTDTIASMFFDRVHLRVTRGYGSSTARAHAELAPVARIREARLLGY